MRCAVERYGRRAFAVECLRPAMTRHALERFRQEPPEYERVGESRVRDRLYSEVIRYRDHVLPVWEAIQQAVDG